MLVAGVPVAVRVAVGMGVTGTGLMRLVVFRDTSDEWAMGFASHAGIVRADRERCSPGLLLFATLAL
jgi:hypothetical protein